MELVQKQLRRVKIFTKLIYNEIDLLNLIIYSYNHTTNINTRLVLLEKIKQHIQRIEKTLPTFISIQLQGFSKLHEKLRSSLEKEYNILSIGKFHVDIEKPDFVRDVLDLMSQKKLSKLVSLLNQNTENKNLLHYIYNRNDTTIEALNYARLLNCYDIHIKSTALSTDISLTHILTQKKFCLRIAEDHNGAKKTESYLKSHGLGAYLPQYMLERQVFFNSKSENQCRIASLQEVEEHKEITFIGYNELPENIFLKQGFEIFLQLAEILQKLSNLNYVFGDLSFNNFRINSLGHLIIHDPSSIVPGNKDGTFSPEDAEMRGNYLYYQKDIAPIEYEENAPFAIDKAHVFALGNFIYQYLCNYADFVLRDFKKADNYDFTDKIFKSQQGVQYVSLIKKLVQNDPQKRPSLKETICEIYWIKTNAYAKFRWLENLSLYRDIETFRNTVEHYKLKTYKARDLSNIDKLAHRLSKFEDNDIGFILYDLNIRLRAFSFVEDKEVDHFVDKTILKIKSYLECNKEQDAQQVVLDFKELVSQIEANTYLQKIKSTIEWLLYNAHDFTNIGMQRKALKIASALAATPLKARLDFSDDILQPHQEKVEKARLSNRFFMRHTPQEENITELPVLVKT